MKRFQLLSLCKKATVVYLQRGISTDPVLLARGRKVKVTPGIPYEPGIRHRREVFQKDSDITEDVEDEADIDNEVNVMNLEEAYDINMREKKRNKSRVQKMIIAQKFFSPRPQPPMLTINERQCIRHLHKVDPVQWDIKTLSESFPATPDTIKKILKTNVKLKPERAKIIDSKVQKNWELLAEGKLDADPHVLEHLKQFINRRHVLLEQIKNEKFYLPEIKKEPVWNKGEFTNVLVKYEKAVKRLVQQTEESKMLESGTSEVKYEEGEQKSALDVVREKVKEAVSRNRLENKDSFLYGGLTDFYSKERTLEELEHEVLKQANKKKSLSILDKAILEDKLGVKYERKSENLTQTESLTPEKIKGSSQWRGRNYEESDMREAESFDPEKTRRSWQSRGRSYEDGDMREAESFAPEKTRRSWQSRGRSYEDGDTREAESFAPEKTRRSWQSRGRSYEDGDMKEAESFDPEKTRRSWQSRGRSYEDGDMREAESFAPEKTRRSWQSRGRSYEDGDMREAESFAPEKTRRSWQSRGRSYEDGDMRGEFIRDMNMKSDNLETDGDRDSTTHPIPDDRTLSANETDIGKLLNKLKNKQLPEKPEAKKKDKPEIDFSDPERIRRENIYYDAEVNYIKGTAFWNSGRSSDEKALAELEKRPHCGPYDEDQSVPLNKTGILSNEPYPLQIEIPKNKRGRGLTFKVKDCYYDDDGQFLYRVPGMS